MPFTYSQGDYTVPAVEVVWYLEMRTRVEAGEKLLLIYNLSAYPENTTDWAGTLERLYLYLGHKQFVNSVFAFGSTLCRYACLPIRPLEELEGFLDDIENSLSSKIFTGYYLQDHIPIYNHLFDMESAEIFEAIRKRFAIRLESPKVAKYMRFKIVEKNSPSLSFVVEADDGKYQHQTDGGIESKPFSWLKFPLDITWVDDQFVNTPYLLKRPWEKGAFSLMFSGTLHILETGLYDFLLGADDGAVLSLDGQIIINNGSSHGFQLLQHSLVLKKGSYPFQVTYADVGGQARLLIDVNRSDDGSLQRSKRQLFKTVRIDRLVPNGLQGRYYQFTNWSGKSKETGKEIVLGESLEAVWTDSPGPSQKPWPRFSLRLEGEMEVRKPGIYYFLLGADDGGLLYLDQVLVLDNDGPHPYREKTATLYLKVGKLTFRLDYFDIMADARLKLNVQRLPLFGSNTKKVD